MLSNKRMHQTLPRGACIGILKFFLSVAKLVMRRPLANNNGEQI